ncbi:hypothetical protein HAX54_004314, partial [Datura stramonium]|nr:hypothetical protein [Datura stramonium]
EERGKSREGEGGKEGKVSTDRKGMKDSNTKQGGEAQKQNEFITMGYGRKEKKMIKHKEKVWSQKPIQQGEQINTKNMFAVLKEQEEIQERSTKITSRNLGEYENDGKNGPGTIIMMRKAT